MTIESYRLENCPYYNSRVIIDTRKMFIRLAIGWLAFSLNKAVVNTTKHFTLLNYDFQVVI